MKKKNHIKMRFSTLLLCCLAIMLCAAPRGWAVIYNDGDEYGEHDVKEDIVGCLEIGADTTVNLYASVSQYVYAGLGSILNIYSGSVGTYVIVSPDDPYANVTVYGTDFAVNSQSVSHGQVVIKGIGELTGTYGGNKGSINLTFICPTSVDVPINLQAPNDPKVEIDIKPGSDLNNINLKSKGVVPVAVLTTKGFEADSVDPETVLFAGAKPERWRMEDVDNDGDEDMLFHFKTKELVESENNPDGLNENSMKATLTAKLIGTMTSAMTTEITDGEVIQGSDEVCIKPQKKEK